LATLSGIAPALLCAAIHARRTAFNGADSAWRANTSEQLSIPAWTGLELIAGSVGSLIINSTGEGKWFDILLGVMGAVLAGWLFNIYGNPV
jgi:hypothetical protein